MKKIMFAMFLMVLFFVNISYAKYAYIIEEKIVIFRRDVKAPKCEVIYSTQEWTKDNVIVTIKTNEEVQQVSDFVLSEDKKTLTKEVSENEAKTVIVKDFSGNYTEVQYEVKNIDKEVPQIIGCENEGVYNAPLTLDYSDNVEIKDIVVDRYSDELELEYKDKIYACNEMYGIDRTNSTLSIHVKNHPLNTVQYSYYLNNELYTTVSDTSYTYTGLQPGMQYTMKVQALDESGNVLNEKEQIGKTTYFSEVKIEYRQPQNKLNIIFLGIDNVVRRIFYTIWDENLIQNLNNNTLSCINENGRIASYALYYDSNIENYYIKGVWYNENNEVLDEIDCVVQKGFLYQELKNELPNKIIEKGQYKIYVNDLAGNEITYYIKVE